MFRGEVALYKCHRAERDFRIGKSSDKYGFEIASCSFGQALLVLKHQEQRCSSVNTESDMIGDCTDGVQALTFTLMPFRAMFMVCSRLPNSCHATALPCTDWLILLK
jgi:hypothetical protein